MHQIKIILLVIIALLLIGVPIFACFSIGSGAHIALREAKNVKLAIQMLDIEYYGQGQSVYDASKPNGLRKGAEEEIQTLLEHDGEIVLQEYDKKNRAICAFTYKNEHYEAVYRYDEAKGDEWQIYYYLKVMD
jgi:hypothetical protein